MTLYLNTIPREKDILAKDIGEFLKLFANYSTEVDQSCKAKCNLTLTMVTL